MSQFSKVTVVKTGTDSYSDGYVYQGAPVGSVGEKMQMFLTPNLEQAIAKGLFRLASEPGDFGDPSTKVAPSGHVKIGRKGRR